MALQPCPNCGNKKIVLIFKTSHGHGDCGYEGLRYSCSECHLAVGNGFNYGYPEDKAKLEVEEQWNKMALKLKSQL